MKVRLHFTFTILVVFSVLFPAARSEAGTIVIPQQQARGIHGSLPVLGEVLPGFTVIP